MTKQTENSISHRAQREREHFDKIASQQKEAWWGHLAASGERRAQRRATLVLKSACAKPGQEILEIGCGGGFFTHRLANMIPREVTLTSIDISPKLIEIARQKPELNSLENLHLEIQNVETLTYDDERFDVVLGSSILHHLDLEHCLPNLFRVMRKGGRFVFAEPNALNPVIAMEKHVRFGHKIDQTSDDESAINRFRLKHMLHDYGFTNVQIKPYDFLHPLTPRMLQPLISGIGLCIEVLPGAREIAGSVLIRAEKPA